MNLSTNMAAWAFCIVTCCFWAWNMGACRAERSQARDNGMLQGMLADALDTIDCLRTRLAEESSHTMQLSQARDELHNRLRKCEIDGLRVARAASLKIHDELQKVAELRERLMRPKAPARQSTLRQLTAGALHVFGEERETMDTITEPHYA